MLLDSKYSCFICAIFCGVVNTLYIVLNAPPKSKYFAEVISPTDILIAVCTVELTMAISLEYMSIFNILARYSSFETSFSSL